MPRLHGYVVRVPAVSACKRGTFSRLMRWLPVRPRAVLALLMLALIAWAPLFIALHDSMRTIMLNLSEEYGRWAGSARIAVKALWTGEMQ